MSEKDQGASDEPQKGLNGRGFLKGSVLTGLATLLGIGAKIAAKKRRVIHATGGSLEVDGVLIAGKSASPELGEYGRKVMELKPLAYRVHDISGNENHGMLVSEQLATDAEMRFEMPLPFYSGAYLVPDGIYEIMQMMSHSEKYSSAVIVPDKSEWPESWLDRWLEAKAELEAEQC